MKNLAVNKKARFDYTLMESYEGGLVLNGAEVKSVKLGHVQLKGAFLDIKKNELWLKNVFISPYEPAGQKDRYKPDADRKVLVHRRELKKLIGRKKAEGLTLVPVRLYAKRGLVKLEFAVAKGKREHEKREVIKKRDVDKQLRQKMKE